MHIDSFFACSNSSLEEAEVVLFGIPYDATQSFKPGSRFAPTAIREASWNLEDFSVYFRRGVGVRFCDAGNVCVDGSFEDIIFESEKEDWRFSGRSKTSRRTITASIIGTGYKKMTENWIYKEEGRQNEDSH